MNRCVLGIDFGTASAHVALVSLKDGEFVASIVHPYDQGVIDEALPLDGERKELEPGWALQDPADYLAVLRQAVPRLLKETGIDRRAVVGLGLDFTSCTILPTTSDGTPLCFLDPYRRQPHAWVKLWKHHASQPEADRINQVALERGEPWLARYGGRISSEWLFPKALQILDEAPDVYGAAARIIEAADWVTWQLTGREVRNACAAGYKAMWSKGQGYPDAGFCRALDPRFETFVRDKLSLDVRPAGRRMGGLTAPWAEAAGLPEGLPVAVAIIDAHAGTVGSGVVEPGKLALIMGTSTCHMLLADHEVFVPGISGVVADGIVPGYHGYEAGQAAVGDIFGWFVEHALPWRHREAAGRAGLGPHEHLEALAGALRPGQSGLLALDWWNGVRSTLVDAELSGLIVGLTLGTRPEEIYRALIEATAYGTRVIVETFQTAGLEVTELYATGGLIRNEMLMQIYADVTGRQLRLAAAEDASALGAAMLAGVAAGPEAGGFESLAQAARRLTRFEPKTYRPIPENRRIYQQLYGEYRRLYDHFGRETPLMKTLGRLRTSA